MQWSSVSSGVVGVDTIVLFCMASLDTQCEISYPVGCPPVVEQMCTVSSNAQASNWLAQDRHYRRLYAAVGHDDFLRASTIVAAGRGAVVGEPLPQLPSWKVLDPHLGLMDVLENHSLFIHQVGQGIQVTVQSELYCFYIEIKWECVWSVVPFRGFYETVD